ncbi:MAG: hypothetical protein ACRDND_05110 [Streptosporangiaceae bacterium]
MTGIHADIDALKGLHQALVRYRHAQRDVTARGEDQLTATRASLEARASRCRAQLELGQAEYTACQDRAAQADQDNPVDCSGYAHAVEQNSARLERIRLWQQRIDAEASEFSGIAGRFAGLLQNDLPRMEEHLMAIIASLEAARRVQPAAS